MFFFVDFQIVKSQALIIIKKGFINSLGCSDCPKTSIHLLAPLISEPYWMQYNNAVNSNKKLISDNKSNGKILSIDGGKIKNLSS